MHGVPLRRRRQTARKMVSPALFQKAVSMFMALKMRRGFTTLTQ